MALSTDFANRANDWLWGGTTPTRPTGRYVHLYTDATTEVSTGAWTNYAAAAFTGTASNAKAATAAADVDFGTATTTGTVNVSHFAIKDQAGNLMTTIMALTGGTKAVTNGDPVKIPAADLDLTAA